MRLVKSIFAIWRLLRSYAVAVALVLALGAAFIEVYFIGTGPATQQPPEGYTIQNTNATLQWDRGTKKEPIQLQIAIDDPDFTELFVDKEVNGKTHRLNDLEPGHTYYWRLVQGDKPSPVATFKTSAYAIEL